MNKHPFQALDVALELVRGLGDIAARIERSDRCLAKQLRNAAGSVVANLLEGNRRMGKDRRYLWNVSAGSADEVRGHLWVATAWGYVGDEDIAPSLALVDRVLAMLYRLTR